MLSKLESFLLNKFLGKVVARIAVVIVGYVASTPIQALLAQVGVHASINQSELTAGMIALANTAFEWFKKRRMANPMSPAVQTDASKPGADVPALVK